VVRVGIVSLGCPKNQVDSERMLALLRGEGFKVVKPSHAEVLIINTCAFIQAATEESIECILEACARPPRRGIIVAGCLPQRYGKKLLTAVPEIDYAIGVGKCSMIADVVRRVNQGKKGIDVSSPISASPPRERILLSPAHYAYLQIADGCSNKCSYCLIPSLRGAYRSRRLQLILGEATELAERGVRELILIAQDSALYGTDLYRAALLPRLLERLARIDGIRWIRILYLHPAHITDQLIDVLADLEKVCKYVDMPIQHISDRILSRMRRKVTSARIHNLVDSLKKKIPNVALRTTVMVGFPGERDEDFDELLQFLEDSAFDAVGMFTFSPEEGTAAFTFDERVERQIAEERTTTLQEVQREISLQKNRQRIGSSLEILIDERIGKGRWRGRAQFHAPDIDGVVYVTGSSVRRGSFVKVSVADADDYDLFALHPGSGHCHSVL